MELGHVHLKVKNLNDSISFYQQIFNLRVTQCIGNFAFLSDSHRHHDLAIQALGDQAPGPYPGLGLYHVAFEVPDKQAFHDILAKLETMNIQFVAVDHQISWAVYFNDPSGNGMEIYVDTRADHKEDHDWTGRSDLIKEFSGR